LAPTRFPLLSLFLLILSLSSCQAQQQRRSSTDFYEGLKKKQAEAKPEASACFEKALDDPNIHIAAAAAAELMSLRYSGAGIRAQTISKIRVKAPAMLASKASGSWAMALDALGDGEGEPVLSGTGPDREKVLALALNNANRSPDDAIMYLLMELRVANALVGFANAVGDAREVAAPATGNSMFSNAENAAIAGRIAVSHSRYREALIFFRMVMGDEPDLFFRYPELLSDLGRSFQYSAAGREGIDLFLQWEKDFDEKKLIEDENLGALIRFRLLFFAARIANQRGSADKNGFPESVELFERALSRALLLSPEIRSGASERSEQIDACVWYILNTSLTRDIGRTIKYLETYITHWQDDGYYSDVMDKLARELLLKRRWTDLINIAALVRNRPGVIGAKFAWITGRAIQAGLLSRRDEEYALKALLGAMPPSATGGAQETAEAYFRIAYNNASIFDGKALYYRSLSAAALGEEFLPRSSLRQAQGTPSADSVTEPVEVTVSAVNSGSPGESDAMEFLLGFFKNAAAKFAPRYIRMMESDLSPEELRQLAEALGNEGLYQESMRLVSLYTKRDSYQFDKRDLELLYPRPFAEQVNRYAQETGIGPAKLYGLIRAESAFNPAAISRSGAIGLTQLMPATAEEMAARILRRGGPDYTRRPDKDGVDEISGDTESPDAAGAAGAGLIASEVSVVLLDPGANIHMGAAYLAYLEDRLGDPLLALLAYNGGMNRVRRWRNSMPVKFPPDLFLETVEYAETMEYGRAVMGAAAMYGALYEETTPESPVPILCYNNPHEVKNEKTGSLYHAYAGGFLRQHALCPAGFEFHRSYYRPLCHAREFLYYRGHSQGGFGSDYPGGGARPERGKPTALAFYRGTES
jgi:soluble lytic murein transglycosylase